MVFVNCDSTPSGGKFQETHESEYQDKVKETVRITITL